MTIYLALGGVVLALGAWGWFATKAAIKARKNAKQAEANLATSQANVRRANAALATMKDNMEKLKNEKSRIGKSDLDGLIAIAGELSDESAGSGEGDAPAHGENVLSGRIVQS